MKFSVLLPTRNRLDLLAHAIESVRRQDFDNWEVIVSDNDSDEDILGYIEALDDPRIQYFRTPCFIPVTDNWNNAIEKCKGDYIIMLGDDDCLMKGYFSTLKSLIEQFESPDFIYTNAFLYAYPRVIPTAPDGFLRTYSTRKIFNSNSQPFWLERKQAVDFVRDSLKFRVTFDYNMQFSLVSRRLVDKMKHYGPFYQSPYPDYYASNAMMLSAERILVVPDPMVTIGISPKSFGFFYFNDSEETGNQFLKNLPDRAMADRLKKVILPGSSMNTSWLFAMETLAANIGRESNLQVNYSRYRFIQFLSVYAGLITGNQAAKQSYLLLKQGLHAVEWLRYGLVFIGILKLLPDRFHNHLRHSFEKLQSVLGSHPAHHMPYVRGTFETPLDVFEQVDPAHVVEVTTRK